MSALIPPNSKKIHIDIDPSEINKIIKVDVGINCDLKNTLNNLLPLLNRKQNRIWFEKIKKWQLESSKRDIINKNTDVLFGAQVIKDIWTHTNGEAIIVTDVGQHQMLEAQYLRP